MCKHQRKREHADRAQERKPPLTTLACPIRGGTCSSHSSSRRLRTL